MSTTLAGRLFVFVALLGAVPGHAGDDPTPQQLIDRHAKEKAPVWADGDRATFFFRGDAAKVTLVAGGESKQLRRLPGSDVWTLAAERPELEKGVFSYLILPEKKDDPPRKATGVPAFETWRGPKAPPAPEVAKELKGTEKLVDVESRVLGEKRKLKVYLPPGHDRTKTYPVVYAADGMAFGDHLEPLIAAGKVPPVILVGLSSGGYRGDRDKPYDVKDDLRALEYLPGLDDDRFAKHERFVCEELLPWAEKELGASKERTGRAVMGASNGGRFAVTMGVRHPDLFGHVFALSVAGSGPVEPPAKGSDPPRFYLAAGTWEPPFHKITMGVADKLKGWGVPVEFSSRVAGHDVAMWREEFVAAVRKAFPKS